MLIFIWQADSSSSCVLHRALAVYSYCIATHLPPPALVFPGRVFFPTRLRAAQGLELLCRWHRRGLSGSLLGTGWRLLLLTLAPSARYYTRIKVREPCHQLRAGKTRSADNKSGGEGRKRIAEQSERHPIDRKHGDRWCEMTQLRQLLRPAVW